MPATEKASAMTTVRIFNHHVHPTFYWLAAADAVLFILAFYGGTYLYFFFEEPGSFSNYINQIPGRALIFSSIAVLCLMAMGLYEPRMREGAAGVLARTVGGFFAATLVMALVFYLLPELNVWRGIFVYATAVAVTFNLINRSLFNSLTDLDQFKRRVLVYGSGHAAATISSSMRRKADRQGFTIVGFVRVGGEEPPVQGERIINLRQHLAEYTRQTEIDQVVVAVDDRRDTVPMEELFECRLNGIRVSDLVNFFEQEAGKILVDFASTSWMTFADGFRCSTASKVA